jgi:hypothetical protein
LSTCARPNAGSGRSHHEHQRSHGAEVGEGRMRASHRIDAGSHCVSRVRPVPRPDGLSSATRGEAPQHRLVNKTSRRASRLQ